MNRKAAYVALTQLDLAGMKSGTDADSKSANDLRDRGSGANATLCAVEQSDHAVAGRLDELPAVLADDLLGQLVVSAHEVAPSRGAVRHCLRRRVDDVGEENGEHRPSSGRRARSGEEAHGFEVDGYPRIIADDPGVVP